MSKMNFKEAATKYFMLEGKGLIDEDKASVMANELWDKACKKDKKSLAKLGKIMRLYKKGELT